MRGRWGRRLVMGLLGIIALPSAARASEVDALLNKLVAKRLLTAVEAQEVRDEIGGEAKARENQQQVFVKETAKDAMPQWTRDLSFGGDLRLRHESFWRDANAGNTRMRHRQRVRLRFGVKGTVTEQLEAGFRLATALHLDPISANQSLQDSFDKKDIFVDLAYLSLSTTGLAGMEALPLVLLGGKFENPFYATSIVWDGDLTPEGAALSVIPTVGPVELFITGGVFPIDEIGTKGGDPTLWAAQAGTTWSVASDSAEEWLKHLTVKGAVGYYNYANLENGIDVGTNSTFGDSGAAAGNVYRPANGLDFDELDIVGEVRSQVLGTPIKLYADYVKNTAIADNGEGVHLGVKLGKADQPLAWELGYFYQRLEPDAVLGLFADSDFGEGGTNRSGHVYAASIGVLKHSTLGVEVVRHGRDHGG